MSAPDPVFSSRVLNALRGYQMSQREVVAARLAYENAKRPTILERERLRLVYEKALEIYSISLVVLNGALAEEP